MQRKRSNVSLDLYDSVWHLVGLFLITSAVFTSDRVQPFGFWACFKHEEPLQLEAMALERNRASLLAQRSPLLGSSMFLSSGSMYNSFANLNLSVPDGSRV